MTKICGVTRVEDALAAVEFGADMVGLIFVPKSPRMVSDETARDIVNAVAGRASVVGVFQNEGQDVILEKRRALKFDLVQLHGGEPRSTAEAVRPCIKGVTYDGNDENVDEVAEQYSGACDYLLFDLPKEPDAIRGRQPNQFLPLKNCSTPFFMAGGINPHNVAAVATALVGNRSFVGIDVASGVESAPGTKDHAKMRALIEKVQEVSLNAIAR
ncbi:MAG TPA: phosphoribosylanthranilate isomerase [Candidatus Obscuribacterales bacterium]